MPFLAKSTPPSSASPVLRYAILDRAAEGGITLFTAPPGYLLADSLSVALAEIRRPTLWVRLDPEDHDPATCLVSLIAGAQRLSPGSGEATLEQMRRHAGHSARWPALFAHLGEELADRLSGSSALVLEHSHHLNDTHPTLALLGTHLLPRLPASVACILTAYHALPQAALPAHTTYRGINDLRLDDRAARGLAAQTEAGLSAPSLHRAVALTGGRAVALAGLCAACAVLGSTWIQQVLNRASGANDLLARIAQGWLETADPTAREALALALRLEYSHPTLVQAVLGADSLPLGPWLQPLADDWTRVRSTWEAALRTTLRPEATLGRETLRRAADFMAAHGAVERAVPLYLELKDPVSAAKAIAESTEMLMHLGLCDVMGDWLDRLPTSVLRAWPWLVYTSGEIAARRGDAHAARGAFTTAVALFTARDDAHGTCQSLLADSTLAAWRGDRAHAQASALAAGATAETAGLAWYQGWAAWQLGCLAAAEGELDDALVAFSQAAAAAEVVGDAVMVELVRVAQDLAVRQHDLGRQREFHRQAYFAAEQAEREAAERLRLLVGAPPGHLDALLQVHGWAHTPLMLKLPPPAAPVENQDAPPPTSLWDAFLRAVGLRRQPPPPAAALDAPLEPPALPQLQRPPAETPPTALQTPLRLVAEQVTTLATTPSGRDERPMEDQASLAVYCLGPFSVYQDDVLVSKWPSGKGKAIFKNMIANRGRPVAKDVLMDLFWPGADADAARNNLNVAIYGLRQAFRATRPDFSHILFQEDHYLLNPEMAVWVDFEAFLHHYEAGQNLERRGMLAEAIREYEVAEGLYRGDFLEEDPYDDWPIPLRERLKDSYLILADRLSRHYFEEKNFTACIQFCKKILAKDECREDAHRRLMRCYRAQGQRDLAVRQYHLCVDALQRVLEVPPMHETVALYRQIRNGEVG